MLLYKTAAERIRSALGAEAFAALRCYPDSLPPSQRPLLEGVWEGESPDFDRLLANAQKANAGQAGRGLGQELAEGLLAFALFEARNALPASKAGELAREVAKALKGGRS